MKNLAPAFQFYASDYLSDANVQMMTLEEEGAYIRLLAYCWREESIPADPESLSKLCKGCSTDVVTVVQRLFNEAPNDKTRLVHKRLDEERAKQKEHRDQRSQAGKNSAAKRSSASQNPKTPTTVATAVQPASNENPTLQSSSSSSSSASQLAGEQTDENKTPKVNPSKNEKLIAMPEAAAGAVVPDIAHDIFRHYPSKMHPEIALAAIQKALTVVDGQVLLAAVKAFADEVERTNTKNPTWPEKWFTKEMWKSYLPVDEQPASQAKPPSPHDDQDLSPFGDDFYEKFNKH